MKVWALHQFTKWGQNMAAVIRCTSKAKATKLLKVHFGSSLMGKKKIYQVGNWDDRVPISDMVVEIAPKYRD